MGVCKTPWLSEPWPVWMSYLTVRTEPVRALVVLHQVSDTRELRICIRSVQCPRVLSQNLAEQTEDQGEVDHWHLDQSTGRPHTFKRLRMNPWHFNTQNPRLHLPCCVYLGEQDNSSVRQHRGAWMCSPNFTAFCPSNFDIHWIQVEYLAQWSCPEGGTIIFRNHPVRTMIISIKFLINPAFGWDIPMCWAGPLTLNLSHTASQIIKKTCMGMRLHVCCIC